MSPAEQSGSDTFWLGHLLNFELDKLSKPLKLRVFMYKMEKKPTYLTGVCVFVYEGERDRKR